MISEPLFRITYSFRLSETEVVSFDLAFDPTMRLLCDQPHPPPDWTRLGQHQCVACPLTPEQAPHCPAALNLAPLVSNFEHLLSHDEIFLEVITEERKISQQTTIQRAVSSLMGLLMAASDCPRTRFFKPMARFHLPLASEEETIYRAAATYMLTQYFRNRQGRQPDFALDGLNEIYRNIQEVNSAMAKRLRGVTKSDSSVNAIILLDMYAKAMPYAIKQALEELAYLFSEDPPSITGGAP
ncbi:DUF6901 family protein [Desulfurivibrio dismutans]|uniref:DUF6901 family protein n=1 Tax=Desulfurivibrio dismutans TaxID=1398908 RepID=UPI0023DAC413|nr:hypothetical protein [Desulfurivibrio alkaliphilus]MDF1614467.1 hypothetical protein [Desulfurivibrio alkaliphilus]